MNFEWTAIDPSALSLLLLCTFCSASSWFFELLFSSCLGPVGIGTYLVRACVHHGHVI